MSDTDCTCNVTGPGYDDTEFDESCPFHGDKGSMVAHVNLAANTDRELYRDNFVGPGAHDGSAHYEPSIHVTAEGLIGINVGGRVIVKSLRDWHALAPESGACVVSGRRAAENTNTTPNDAAREYCRRWLEDETGPHRCNAPADCIPWGKFLDSEHTGPRCYPCAEEQIGYRNVHDPAWAIYHFPDAGLRRQDNPTP